MPKTKTPSEQRSTLMLELEEKSRDSMTRARAGVA